MSKMSAARIKTARETYRKTWGRRWPWTNDYLTVLWKETKEMFGLDPSQGGHLPKELDEVLGWRMRECDPAE